MYVSREATVKALHSKSRLMGPPSPGDEGGREGGREGEGAVRNS